MNDGRSESWAPFIASAKRFDEAARKFVDSTADRSVPASVSQEAARSFSEFLREHSFEVFRLPWAASFYGSEATPPAASILDIPALGLMREHQQRSQRTADAARRIGEAQRRLLYLWSDTLRDAAAKFCARLSRPEPGSPPAAALPALLRSLYDGWIDCAEQAYARMAHSDSFCEALAEFVNASAAWRAESQASIEQAAKLLDLPTRSELNTLTQRLKYLEEQLAAERAQRGPRRGDAPAGRPQRPRRTNRGRKP